MPDIVEKTFVRSFLNFLKSKIESQTLNTDAQESVEVAMQCLQAAFDCEDDEDQAAAATAAQSNLPLKEIDLYELFQSTCIERTPETLALAEKIKNEGNQLMKDGKYNEALLEYNRAIAFDPKNSVFYCNRAAAYIRLGDNERAITDCKSALTYNNNYGKAYGRLGIAYSNLGKYDEAQQAYAKAIQLEPENQDYRNNLEVARNARNQQSAPGSVGPMPELTEGLNVLLNNPAITNLMNGAGLDLDQLHSMSQNPMIMSAVGQMFNALQASGLRPPAGGATAGQLPPDLVNVLRTMSEQLSNRRSGGNNQNSNHNQPQGDQQPPPSS